jgi:hypothetical protein
MAQTQSQSPIFARSRSSCEYETFWRSLRGTKSMPARGDFQPAKARHFLGDLVLVEAPTAEQPAIRIRVTGQRFDSLIGANLTGRDNLEFMPEQYRPGAIAAAHAMLNTPCGLWQITPAHLVYGYATNLEITAFPLGPDETGRAFILIHVLPAGGLRAASLPTGRGVGIDTAVTHCFIDVGAGLPVQAVRAA